MPASRNDLVYGSSNRKQVCEDVDLCELKIKVLLKALFHLSVSWSQLAEYIVSYGTFINGIAIFTVSVPYTDAASHTKLFYWKCWPPLVPAGCNWDAMWLQLSHLDWLGVCLISACVSSRGTTACSRSILVLQRCWNYTAGLFLTEVMSATTDQWGWRRKSEAGSPQRI